MSITVRMIGGRYTPLVTCDTCGRSITDPGMAAVVYNMEGEADRHPEFAHKGRCHDAADDRIRRAGGYPGWNELTTWVAQLLHNTGLRGETLGRAFDTADMLHEMGL